MNIDIEDIESVALINNLTPFGEEKVSTIRLFVKKGNSFNIAFKAKDAETVYKIRAALDLIEGFIIE